MNWLVTMPAWTERDSQTLRYPLHLGIQRPKKSLLRIGARQKMRVHVAQSSASQTEVVGERHHFVMTARRWSAEEFQIPEEVFSLRHAHPEVQLHEHQGMDLGNAFLQDVNQPTDVWFVPRERQPDVRVDRNHSRTRRRRAAAAAGTVPYPAASRCAANCRRRASRPSSMTAVRVAAVVSFLRRRSSVTALMARSSSASLMSSVVRTPQRISSAQGTLRLLGNFFARWPITPRGRSTGAHRTQ
jgi:hypothetical protein